MFIEIMYSSCLKRFATCALLALLTPCATAGIKPAVRSPNERIVIIFRHGLRAPIETSAELTAIAGRKFPTWPVASGELTPRGQTQLAGMARSIGNDVFGRSALNTSCKRRAMVWADVRDRRTIRSGEIVAEALGKCSDASRHAAAGVSDPLFDATRAAACQLPPDAFHPTDGEERTSRIAGARYLAYAQGLPFQTDGATERDAVFAAMPAHEHQVERQFSTLPAAGARTAGLTQAIIAFLDGKASSRSPLPASAQIAAIVGHDTDLAELKAVFGLGWTLPGQPDSTAPATALVLRTLPAGPDGRQRVSASIYYQTLSDIRAGIADRPRRIDLHFAACRPGTRCGWQIVRSAALSAVPEQCRWRNGMADRKVKR